MPEFVWITAQGSKGENAAFLLEEDDEKCLVKWASNGEEEWLFKNENTFVKDSDKGGRLGQRRGEGGNNGAAARGGNGAAPIVVVAPVKKSPQKKKAEQKAAPVKKSPQKKKAEQKAEPRSNMAESSNSDTDTEALPIGSLKEWKDRQPPLPILDLRSLEDYQTRHVTGSVHIPLSEVRQRSYELPPRQNAFAVLVPASPDEQTALEMIRMFFLCRDDWPGAKRQRRAQKPWLMPLVILASDSTNWDQGKELGIVLESSSNEQAANTNTTFCPLPRLWQPDSMVKDVLLPLLTKRLQNNNNNTQEIWDLGAGAGRDVCFLAEELKATSEHRNFNVVAMDQRYRCIAGEGGEVQEGQGQEKCSFWKRRNLGDVTRCVCIQWDNEKSSHEKWFKVQAKGKQVLCLYMVRFWNKCLMEFLAKSDLLEKGTLIAVSQFAKASPGASWSFEHPKEKHVLKRDEPSRIFCAEAGWTILHDNIVQDSDHGRTLVNFVAMKE